MKSLPKLTICCLGLITLALLPIIERGPLSLLADDAAESSPQQEDTATDPQSEQAPGGESPAAEATQLLQEARRRLIYDRQSVQANLRETVSIGPRKFRGEGSYVAGPFPKLRLALAIDVGGTQGDLLEVCDGTILWTVQRIATPGS